MSDPKPPLRTESRVEDERLIIEAYREMEFRSLDGDGTTTADVLQRRIVVEAEEDMASKLGHELLGWASEQGSSGPPGQKPMHQQYAEAESDP